MFAGNKNAAKLAVEGVVEGAAADGKTTFTLPGGGGRHIIFAAAGGQKNQQQSEQGQKNPIFLVHKYIPPDNEEEPKVLADGAYSIEVECGQSMFKIDSCELTVQDGQTGTKESDFSCSQIYSS